MAEREFRDEVGGLFRTHDDENRSIVTSIQSADYRNRPYDELRVALNVLVWVRNDEGIRDALANAHREILEGAERGFRDISEMSQKFAEERDTK